MTTINLKPCSGCIQRVYWAGPKALPYCDGGRGGDYSYQCKGVDGEERRYRTGGIFNVYSEGQWAAQQSAVESWNRIGEHHHPDNPERFECWEPDTHGIGDVAVIHRQCVKCTHRKCRYYLEAVKQESGYQYRVAAKHKDDNTVYLEVVGDISDDEVTAKKSAFVAFYSGAVNAENKFKCWTSD